MQQSLFTVKTNDPLSRGVYRMTLAGDTSAIARPGQFVNIQIPGKFLRRPISVCDCAPGLLTLIYKVVGGGTAELSAARPGGTLDLLTGLGNGYDTAKSGDRPLLIGGGVGVPPLYWLCRVLRAQGREVSVILGFNTAAEVFYEEAFSALGAQVTVTTVDGSYGRKGFAADAMAALDYTCFYACGPLPMLRAVEQAARTTGQYSFEERMGCGFGACMGCSCQTKNGPVRICREGPVLDREVVVW